MLVLIAEFYLVDRGLRHRLPFLIAEFYLVDRGLRHRLYLIKTRNKKKVERGLRYRLHPGRPVVEPACWAPIEAP